MAGSIFVSKQSVHDLRAIDFAWLAGELRAKSGPAAVVLSKVLWPHDVGGMDMLEADKLDATEFKLFAHVMREIYESSAQGGAHSGMTLFLASLIQHIEKDARYS